MKTRIEQWWNGILFGCAAMIAGCSIPIESEEVEVLKHPVVTPTTQTFSFPFGLPPDGVGVAAKHQLNVGDRADVTASISSSQSANIGVDARVGSLWTGSSVLLRERAHVEGDVTSGSSINLQNGVTITGNASANRNPRPFTVFTWAAPRQTSGTDVWIEPDQTRSLAPGEYGHVSVKSRSTLELESGSYVVRSLALEPQSRLVLKDVEGPTVIHISEAFTVRGTISTVSEKSPELLFDYIGTEMASLESPMLGTVLAPNATIKLGRTGEQTHRGAFFGRNIEIEPDTKIVQESISIDLVRDPGPHGLSPIGECVVSFEDGTYAAVFGAVNHKASPVSLPRGNDNRIAPESLESMLPDAFLQGSQRRLFTVDFDGNPVSWTLDDRTATLSKFSKACDESGVFEPIRDTKVSLAEPSRSFGRDTVLAISDEESSLIEFDRAAIKRLLGLGQYVGEAKLRLEITAGAPDQIEILMMDSPWTESASWVCSDDHDPEPDENDCPAGLDWSLIESTDPIQNPWHVRYEGEAPSQEIEENPAGKYTLVIDVTDDVLDWLASPWDQFGWLLKQNGEGAEMEFGSRESVSPPQLVVMPGVAKPSNLPPRFVVDTTVEPRISELEPIDGTPRPVAALADEDGRLSEFVANELVMMADDDAVAQELATKWNGSIAMVIRYAEAGMPELGNAYLLRIDPSPADPALAEVFLHAIDNRPSGVYRVSDENALRLLSVAAEQAALGAEVAINWVDQSALSSHHDRTLSEGPSQYFSVSSNPETWPYMAAGTVQDIGVTDGWRVLLASGHLLQTIGVGVIDLGFDCDSPEFDAWDFRGLLLDPCRKNKLEGEAKEWHGTEVVSAGFAPAGDGYGAAGPGGPVTLTGIGFTTAHDGFGDLLRLPLIQHYGADIINMSYTAKIPAIATPFEKPYSARTKRVSKKSLIFASAGNDGDNVDSKDCLAIYFFKWEAKIVCWEKRGYFPCESAGVDCVGGLKYDATTRDHGSNYGSKSVDIFGPYDVFVGPTPNDSQNGGFDIASGTSMSAPFVAGVAAMVWAVDPYMSRSSVHNYIWSTAHSGSPDSTVERWVDAARAVGRAYGQDPAPLIEITTPVNGSTQSGSLLCMGADTWDLAPSVDDKYIETPVAGTSWTIRPGEGNPGLEYTATGAYTCIGFPGEGEWIVTAATADSAGQTSSVTHRINLVNEPPEVWIRSPAPNLDGRIWVWPDTPTTLMAQVLDPNEVGTFPCERVEWKLDGEDYGTGCVRTITFESGAEHTIELRAIDLDGAEGSVSYGIQLRAIDPSQQSPIVAISTPAEDAHYNFNHNIRLLGAVVFVPEDRVILSHRWWISQGDTISGGSGAGTETIWTPGNDYNLCGRETPATINYTVTDSAGESATSSVDIVVMSMPC